MTSAWNGTGVQVETVEPCLERLLLLVRSLNSAAIDEVEHHFVAPHPGRKRSNPAKLFGGGSSFSPRT